MMIYIYLFFTTIIIYAINNLLIKKNFLSSQTGEKHQTFVEKKNIVLSGGIYLGFFTSIIFFLSDYKMFGIFILFFLFLGLFVDAKIITKPYIRFFLQLFLVIGITYFYDLQIISTRVPLFDYFLKYKLLNYSIANHTGPTAPLWEEPTLQLASTNKCVASWRILRAICYEYYHRFSTSGEPI
jgi:UDP-N-acetylmuramyl pentapeptide phosphotransferase/UDP-N-acetylglucosamine-1-phosphate transferase